MMRTHFKLSLVLWAAAGCSAHRGASVPEDLLGSRCIPGNAHVSLSPEGTLPANIPFIVVTPGPVPEPEFMKMKTHLEREDGSEVEPSAEVNLGGQHTTFIRLQKPLESGATYHVVFHSSCAKDEPGVTKRYRFTATPPRPVPTAVGTLSVAETGREQVRVAALKNGFSEGETERIDAAVARFTLKLHPSLIPFLPAIQWTFQIEGSETWSSLGYGGIQSDGRPRSQRGFYRPIFEVFADCDATRPRPEGRGVDHGLRPGRYRAVLHANSGAMGHPVIDPPPLAVDFTLDCGGAADRPPRE